MTDFHTHILPGIDDGARDIEISLRLISELKRQGISDIVLTPHFYCGEMNLNKFLLRRNNAFDTVMQEVGGSGIKFHLGAEVLISSFKIGDFDDFTPLKIGDTKYILLELPFYKTWSEQVIKNVEDIVYNTDLIPVIAHVERYPAVLRRPQLVDELIDIGCFIQMNAGSLYKDNLKKLSEKLVERHKIHCFGTDCHNMTTRPPAYSNAFDKLSELGGKEYAENIQQNMRTILGDGVIKAKRTPRIKKNLWFYA